MKILEAISAIQIRTISADQSVRLALSEYRAPDTLLRHMEYCVAAKVATLEPLPEGMDAPMSFYSCPHEWMVYRSANTEALWVVCLDGKETPERKK